MNSMYLYGVPAVIIYLSILYLFLLIVVFSHFQDRPQIPAVLYALLVIFSGISIIFTDLNYQIKLQVILLSLLYLISDFILYKILLNKKTKN